MSVMCGAVVGLAQVSKVRLWRDDAGSLFHELQARTRAPREPGERRGAGARADGLALPRGAGRRAAADGPHRRHVRPPLRGDVLRWEGVAGTGAGRAGAAAPVLGFMPRVEGRGVGHAT
jgi:hypothetical protein